MKLQPHKMRQYIAIHILIQPVAEVRFIVGEQFSYVFLLSAAALVYSCMPN